MPEQSLLGGSPKGGDIDGGEIDGDVNIVICAWLLRNRNVDAQS